MDKLQATTTVLDVSQGLGFGLLYHPVIGESRSKKIYPFLFRFAAFRAKKLKKRL